MFGIGHPPFTPLSCVCSDTILNGGFRDRTSVIPSDVCGGTSAISSDDCGRSSAISSDARDVQLSKSCVRVELDVILNNIRWSEFFHGAHHTVIPNSVGSHVTRGGVLKLISPAKSRDEQKWECWKYNFLMDLFQSRRLSNRCAGIYMIELIIMLRMPKDLDIALA